ncbi:MAG: hypothetical protein IT370_08600 [Deltaproteobacteria bacterium]|nr:hypothetical protein [Deltaproteobacteria bacterium]
MKRGFVATLALVVAVVVIVLGGAGVARATPRFAARNGMPCAVCHVNPAGGGMRTAYGRGVFARLHLSSPTLQRVLGERGGNVLEPELGRALTMGGDLRTGYLYAAAPGADPSLNTFFVMQADLYLAAELGRHTTLYVDRGAYGAFEAFALLHAGLRETAADENAVGRAREPPSVSGYLKVGRFMPTYGLRMDSHSMFTREGLGLGAGARDSGVEAGLYLGPVLLQGAYLKGALTDQSREGTVYGRAEWLRGGSGLRWMLGGSVAWTPNAAGRNPALAVPLDASAGVREWKAALHLVASVGRLGLLGEVDWVVDRARLDELRGRAAVTYAELNLLVAQGVEVGLSHEWQDPDFDLASGVVQRVGARLEVHPWDATELRLDVRHTLAPEGHALDGVNDVSVLLHLFF